MLRAVDSSMLGGTDGKLAVAMARALDDFLVANSGKSVNLLVGAAFQVCAVTLWNMSQLYCQPGQGRTHEQAFREAMDIAVTTAATGRHHQGGAPH